MSNISSWTERRWEGGRGYEKVDGHHRPVQADIKGANRKLYFVDLTNQPDDDLVKAGGAVVDISCKERIKSQTLSESENFQHAKR